MPIVLQAFQVTEPIRGSGHPWVMLSLVVAIVVLLVTQVRRRSQSSKR